MGFFENLKKNIKGVKEVVENEKNLTNKSVFKVVNGSGSVFTSQFGISLDKEGNVLINGEHKVTILDCEKYVEVETVKSTGKKLVAGATGGLFAGVGGAVVGALAFGNDKKKVNEYSKLIAVDERGFEHNIVIKANNMDRRLIHKLYMK